VIYSKSHRNLSERAAPTQAQLICDGLGHVGAEVVSMTGGMSEVGSQPLTAEALSDGVGVCWRSRSAA
jgi:hypothetical protein